MTIENVDETNHRWTDSASRTRRLLQAASVGLWDWDLVTNDVYFSPEWKRQLGFMEHELPDHFDSWAGRLHPDDVVQVLDAVQAFREGRRATYDIEFRMQHRNGEYRWILAQAEIARDADGRAVRMMGSHVDITQRKRTEAALRESEARFEHALDATLDGLWDWSIATGEVYFSPQWARLMGYEPDDVPQRVEFFFSVAHPDDVARITLRIEDHLAGKTPTKQDEVRLRTKSGEYRWFYDRGKVVSRAPDGTPLRMVGTITDITDRKRAEVERAKLELQLQQAQKMESVGRLAGGVAHDFNNMLGVILGHTELALANVPPGHEIYDDLRGIREAASRSADLTRQLLAFARQQSVTPKVVDLNERVRGMMTLLPRLLGENVALDSVAAPDLWPIKIDPSQVDQILTNLCVNARKAISDVGTIRISTANRHIDDAFCAQRVNCVPGDYVCLCVADTGRGMDDATLAHIFEPFFTTSSAGEGIGLGLATVFGAVTQNHGFIDVTSAPNAGAIFEIYLPRYLGPEDVATAQAAVSDHSARARTVLLVEDEPALLGIAAKMLQSQGYRVLKASGPEEAIHIAENADEVIDLVLTDVIMPRINGRELLTALHAIRPSLRHLFMSGYPADVIADQGVLDESVSFLQKPFRLMQLAAKVQEALDAERLS